MKRIVIILFSFLALVAGAWTCDKTNPGDAEVQELKSMVLDGNGNIAFDKTLVNGPYQIGVETIEDAAELVKLYVGEGFAGEEYTRTIPGDKGTIQVFPGKASIFYSVHFEVAGIPSFILNVKNGKTMGDMETGYSGTYHKCKVCGFTWKSTSSICPRTAKHGR